MPRTIVPFRLLKFVGVFLFTVFIFNSVVAADSLLTFSNSEQQALYEKLTKELRCLVCQNQNLADSNADLAKDLRQKSWDMVNEGKDYEYIVQYMIDRYGDFVVYRPPLNRFTLLLWIGPFVLIVILILSVVVRKRTVTTDSTHAEIMNAKRLIKSVGDND
jgi:cytochrome c-type biogenesis protein CcmH